MKIENKLNRKDLKNIVYPECSVSDVIFVYNCIISRYIYNLFKEIVVKIKLKILSKKKCNVCPRNRHWELL